MSASAAAPARTIAPADLAYVAVFAALIAALALVPSFLLAGVPFSFAVIGVALAGLALGPWRGAAAVGLYVAAGAAGLPIFSGGRAGLGTLFGPTGGYILSFTLAALVIGAFARLAVRLGITSRSLVWMLAGCVVARLALILPLGVAGLHVWGGMGIREALLVDLPFIPLDLIKFVVAALLAVSVHKAFPRLLGR